MDEVLDEEEQVSKKYSLCLLIISPNFNNEILEIFKGVDMAIILAAGGRSAEVPRDYDVYVCTYLPGDIKPGQKPIGPLKMLSMCGRIAVF